MAHGSGIAAEYTHILSFSTEPIWKWSEKKKNWTEWIENEWIINKISDS